MNQYKSLYRSWFPPIYRRDYGIRDVFRILLRRLIILAASTAIMLLIGVVLWQITPKNLSTFQDWRTFGLRLIGVGIIAYFLFIVARLYRSVSVPRPRLEEEEREQAERLERDFFGKAIGAAIGASTFLQPMTGHAEPMLPEEQTLNRLIMRIADLLHEHESLPYLIDVQTTNRRLLDRAVYLGFNIMRLFSGIGFLLTLARAEKRPLSREDLSKIDEAIHSFKPRTFMMNDGSTMAAELPRFLVGLISPKESEKRQACSDADVLVEWLESVDIQVLPMTSEHAR